MYLPPGSIIAFYLLRVWVSSDELYASVHRLEQNRRAGIWPKWSEACPGWPQGPWHGWQRWEIFVLWYEACMPGNWRENWTLCVQHGGLSRLLQIDLVRV